MWFKTPNSWRSIPCWLLLKGKKRGRQNSFRWWFLVEFVALGIFGIESWALQCELPRAPALTLIEVLCRVWPCFPQEPHWEIKMIIFGGEKHNLTALSSSMERWPLLNTLLSSCWIWVSERLWHRSCVCLLRLFTTCASRGAHPGHPWQRKTRKTKGNRCWEDAARRVVVVQAIALVVVKIFSIHCV